MDTLSSFSSLSDLAGNISAISDMLSTISSVMGFVIFIILGVSYALNGFQNMYIGRKTGLDKDWMPFVPFAHTIYRLQMVNEEWWKMFFLEFSLLYGGIVYMIINAISNGQWKTFASIVLVFYFACCIAYRLYYRFKFYKAFNITPVLCLLFLTFWGLFVRVIDLLIAFTDNFEFTGEGMGRTVAGTAKSVVNVRESNNTASISGLSGMYAGQTLPVAANDEMIIGRDNAFCNLIVDQNADKVSRKHCGIVYDSSRKVYQVTDYSTNGTFVDGGSRLIANMPTTLQSGTVIALGSRENRFRLN